MTALISVMLPVAAALTLEQEAKVRQIGAGLRCPTCTGLPITESGDALSVQMRREVREQVKAGQTERDIYALMATRYGNAALLKPPKQGLNLVLWGIPLLALWAGTVHFWRTFRFQQTGRRPGKATDPYRAPGHAVNTEQRLLNRGRRSAQPSTAGVRGEGSVPEGLHSATADAPGHDSS